MRKTLLALVVMVLLAGCGSAGNVADGKKDRNDPYNPVQSHNPNLSDEVKPNQNLIPGKGGETFESQTNIEVLALPGSPVLITDKYFNILYGSSDKDGAKKIIEILKKKKIEYLNHVIVPSSSPETISGMSELLTKAKIEFLDILSGSDSIELKNVTKIAADNSIVTQPAIAGSKWAINGVEFEILYPMTIDMSDDDTTARTCVMRIEKDGVSAILTGDINETICKKLIERGKLVPTTYVIATNGAPADSITREFLDAVKPEKVIVGMRTAEAGGLGVETQSVKKSGTVVIPMDKKPAAE